MDKNFSTFPRRKGSDGTHGIDFEWETTLLAYLQCVEQHEEWKKTKNSGVKSFFVANNVNGVGAFDDVVVKKEIVRGSETKTKLTFTQCKHVAGKKSNPKKGSNYLTHNQIQKYFDSFIEVYNIFRQNDTTPTNFDAQETKILNRLELKKLFSCQFSDCEFSFVSNIFSFPKGLFEKIENDKEYYDSKSNDNQIYKEKNEYRLCSAKCLEFLDCIEFPEQKNVLVPQFCNMFRFFSIPDQKAHSEIDDSLSRLCKNYLVKYTTHKYLSCILLDETKLTFEASILLNEKLNLFQQICNYFYLLKHSKQKITTYNQSITLNVEAASEMISTIQSTIETHYPRLMKLRIYRSLYYLNQKYLCMIINSEGDFRMWELARCTQKYKMESKAYIFFESCNSSPGKEETNEIFVKLVHNSLPQRQTTLYEQLHEDELNVVVNSQLIFQGFEVVMKDLCNNWNDCLDEDTVCNILESTKLVIGTNIPMEQKFYIKRKLKVRVLNNEVRNMISSSIQSAQKKGFGNFLLFSHQEKSSYNINDSCQFIENTQDVKMQLTNLLTEKEASFYFCTYYNDKFELRYQFGKECGNLENRIVDEEYLITECEREKITFLSDKAGMGKSTSMLKLAQEYKSLNKTHWVYYIQLGKLSVNFETPRTLNQSSNAINFLASQVLKLKGIDFELFTYACNATGNVAIFLDGFDELSPKAREIFPQYLLELENTEIRKIFVSSRQNMMQDLEKLILQNSIEFDEFSFEEKEQCLLDTWIQKLAETRENIEKEKLKKIASKIIKDTESEKNSIKEILAIPLQIKMFAVAYYDKMMEYCKSNIDFNFQFDIVGLYENFIRSQAIHYHEKAISDWNDFSEHEKNKRIRGKLRGVPEHVCSLILPQLVKNIKDMKDDIENLRDDLGLIIDSDQMPPLFLHKTIAEYLAAEYIVKQFLSQANGEENEQAFESLLKEDGYEILRMFINSFLQENNFPAYFKKMNPDIKALSNVLMTENTSFHTAAFEGNVRIMKALLQRNKYIINLKNQNGITALQYNCSKSNTEGVQFLLSHQDCSVIECDNAGNTALHYAAENDNAKIMKMLIDRNISLLNMQNNARWTPLHCVCWNDKIEALNFLLSQDCSVIDKDKYGNTVFHVAAKRGNTEVMKILLQNHPSFLNLKDNFGWTALHFACLEDKIEAVKFLLSQKCSALDRNIYGNTAIHNAAKKGHTEIIEILLQSEASFLNMQGMHDCTPLHCVCMEGNTEAAKLLLSYYNCSVIVVNNEGNTAFHYAAENGHTEIMEIMLGKDHLLMNMQNKIGYTALHLACWSGNIAAANFLLSQDCSVIACDIDDHDTALHIAAQRGHTEIMAVLLQHDASLLNMQNKGGWTPLHCACFEGNLEVVRFLLNNACSIKQSDTHGETVLHLAALTGHIDILMLLLERGKSMIKVKNNKGLTPLRVARLYGTTEAVNLIIKFDSKKDRCEIC